MRVEQVIANVISLFFCFIVCPMQHTFINLGHVAVLHHSLIKRQQKIYSLTLYSQTYLKLNWNMIYRTQFKADTSISHNIKISVQIIIWYTSIGATLQHSAGHSCGCQLSLHDTSTPRWLCFPCRNMTTNFKSQTNLQVPQNQMWLNFQWTCQCMDAMGECCWHKVVCLKQYSGGFYGSKSIQRNARTLAFH